MAVRKKEGLSKDEARALDTYVKLVRAADAVTQRIHRHLDEVGLTISQFGVLEVLYHVGPLCQKDLAAKILKSSGNITMVIDNLERNELVRRERGEDDRRFLNVHLTDKGLALFEKVWPKHVTIVAKEMAALPVAQQEELARLCRKLGLSLKGE